MRLEKKQARLNERLNSLVNELKTENIDYAAFLENCPANENEEDETSTSTASGKSNLSQNLLCCRMGVCCQNVFLTIQETQAHYDDDFENMMDYEEDEEDENGGVSSSNTNKYTIDDYEDTESDTNTAFSRNRKRKISSTSKQTSKYTDESTDSISSDITVEIYANDDHEQKQKRKSDLLANSTSFSPYRHVS